MIDIKKIIKAKGWTISALAKELGITQSALSQQINNESITFVKVEKIADIIGVSLSEFVAEAEGNEFLLTCPHCKKTFIANIR